LQLFKHFLIVIIICGVNNATAQTDNFIIRANQKLIAVVMEDVLNPPVASRAYMYPNIAAYQVLAMGNNKLQDMSGQITHLPKLLSPNTSINYTIAADIAFCIVARKLVFSEYLIDSFMDSELQLWHNTISDTAIINASVQYGQQSAKQIIDWIVKDNYTNVKTLQRYVLADSLAAWKPTPPEYTNALEPNWPLMRSISMPHNAMHRIVNTIKYSEQKKSAFYKQALAAYKQSKTMDSVQKSIALFWDCNPNISVTKGHTTFFVHKISPGGHWLNIALAACNNLNKTETETAEICTMVSIAVYDGFISCWDNKFKTNSIRPETYITKLIDKTWEPFIQTPPFPEYPSGHSCISAAAATILTHYIPQAYSYTDSTEMYINIPPRHFKSFAVAAQEASLSRYYGGIHFMSALNNGAAQGEALAKYILKTIKTKSNEK
jgi:membrane-associated phospholipid phosphatase